MASELNDEQAAVTHGEKKATGRRPRSRFAQAKAFVPYVPPARVARTKQLASEHEMLMLKQRDEWILMKKRINGVINRINTSNIKECAKDLLRLNIIRGKGVFCKSILRAQLAAVHMSSVYAALVAVINTRIPEITELLLYRLVSQLKKGYAEREKGICSASLRFMSHLFIQQIIDELPLLEFLSTCLVDPSNGSTELAICVIHECGHFLAEKSPQATEMVYTRLREVLHNGAIDYRTQVLVDNAMELRRVRAEKEASVPVRLDLVDEDDVIQHSVSLEDEVETMDELNMFSFDKDFDENESLYGAIRDILLGDSGEKEPVVENEDSGDANAETEKPQDQSKPPNGDGAVAEQNSTATQKNESAKDMTESDLVDFRRLVYLKIMSAASFEECAHKLINFMKSNGGMELELCKMVVECCSQEKSFLRYYGLLGQRLSLLSKKYVACFEEQFATVYASIHRYDTRKIRNIGTFFATLLAGGALSWALMSVVRLVEEETTASSRIFLKVLFQEVAKTVGEQKMTKLFSCEKLPTILPRDSAKNTRFAINFFTSIGLGYVTEDLREHLKQAPVEKREPSRANAPAGDAESSLSSSSLSSSSLSSSSGISDDREENSDKRKRPSSGNVSPERPRKATRS